MKRRFSRALMSQILMVLMIASGATFAAMAQTDTGRVVGTVADSTGAFIPGATVRADEHRHGCGASTDDGGLGRVHISGDSARALFD